MPLKTALSLKAIIPVLLCFSLLAATGHAQTTPARLTPGETVKQFYRLLHEKKYVDAFRLHVCAPAVEKLTPEESAEFEEEFARIAGGIPEKIDIGGESIIGNDATVFVKIPVGKSADGVVQTISVPVNLILTDEKWIIGDRDTQSLAQFHKSKFFSLSQSGVFSVMIDNEEKAGKAVNVLIEIEQFFARNHRGQYGTLQELVADKANTRSDLGQMLEQLEDGEYFGYRFEIELTENRKGFVIHATPQQHNIDGRYSYFADLDGTKYRNYGGVKLEKTTPGIKPLLEAPSTTTTTVKTKSNLP